MSNEFAIFVWCWVIGAIFTYGLTYVERESLPARYLRWFQCLFGWPYVLGKFVRYCVKTWLDERDYVR
jgi:hypothetical protein